MNIPRRSFLLVLASVLLRAEDRSNNGMRMLSVRPEDLEMPLDGFSAYITPIDRFFVRTHVPVPTVNVSEWRLRVDGEVTMPLSLTIEDLRRLPAIELISVVECAGNGRGFYEPSVPGLQWANGGVGNGRWRGARLADVLRRSGVKPSAREVLFDGADLPLGTMPDFQRSIPIKKALDLDTILAYDMNGETLPVKHGFPLRVVAPGWAGDSWIKWLTSIRVLDKEHDGFWMKNAYRHPGKPTAPGASIPAELMQPVTSLRVKSVITSPVDGAQVAVHKPSVIRGVAWSGETGPVTSVDVSVDGGRSWRLAALRQHQQTPFGWRQWEFKWTPSREAYYTILARARDTSGETQPLDQEWNPSGYGWNVVPRVGLNVVNESSERLQTTAPSVANVPSPAALKNACATCHDEDVIHQQRLSRTQWDREINKMTGWGAKVNKEDRDELLDFLVRNFGPRLRER